MQKNDELSLKERNNKMWMWMNSKVQQTYLEYQKMLNISFLEQLTPKQYGLLLQKRKHGKKKKLKK